jgi:hypothetical protein
MRVKPVVDKFLCSVVKSLKKLLNILPGQELLCLRDSAASNISQFIYADKHGFCLADTQGQWVNIQADAAATFK